MDPRVKPEDDRERNVMPDVMRHPWKETSEPVDPRVALRLPEDDWKRGTSCRTRCGIHANFQKKIDPRVEPEDDRERNVMLDVMRHPWRKEKSTSIPGREPKTKAAWKSVEQLKKDPLFRKKARLLHRTR